MSTAPSSKSTKRNLNLESSINNLGDFEIRLDISNNTSETIKINLNNDFLSAINEVCDKYEINESDRQIIIKNTIDEIEKIINNNEKTIIYPESNNNNIYNDDNSNNNDNNNILISNSKFSYNTPKKNDMKIITFKKQKTSTSKSPSKNNIEFNKKNNLNIIKENSPKKKKNSHKQIYLNKLGERMYEKAMKKIQIQKMKNENIKKDLTESYSFFPETNKNKNKKLLASKSLEKLKIEDRLILKGLQSRKNKMNKFIEKSYVNDIKNITDENEKLFSYSPKLNDNKNKILLNNYSFDTKKKSNVEEKNKILFDKIYTFHPEINEKSKNYIKNYSKKNLISRLIKNNKENEEIIIDKKKLSNSLKKKIELKNKERKNEEINYKDIIQKETELLQNKNSEYKDIIQKETELLQNKNSESSTKSDSNEINTTIIENYNKKKLLFKKYTNKVINETLIIKYKQIFDKLDGDKDGLISYNNLKVNEIEKEDLIQISSLICEIKTKKLTNLSFDDFKKLLKNN